MKVIDIIYYIKYVDLVQIVEPDGHCTYLYRMDELMNYADREIEFISSNAIFNPQLDTIDDVFYIKLL